MRKATGGLSAALGFVGVCGLTVLGCTSKQIAPEIDIRLRVSEHNIYVELPKRTAMSVDELRKSYYKGRRTLSHIRARCVTTLSKDGSCTKTTDVRITAVEGAKFIDADKAPDKPQLIAWVENLGTAVTFDGIEPMGIARYALVVDTLPRVNPAILLVAFPGERAVRGTPARDTTYGRVYRCHNYGQQLISDADYQVCGYHRGFGGLPAPKSLSSPTMFTSMLTWMSASDADDPTWFSCASGCCTSSATIAIN
ncbi:MAG: hypothetical protein M3P26_12995 [Gemmatimonadota bacterium]|nr:hypothetical protein [Gemmatimonadota bacterium]